MSIDIKELLKICPEELARKQHDALKEYVVKHLKSFAALLYDEKYGEAIDWLFECPFGGEAGLGDIGEIINQLKELKHKSKGK